MESKKVELVHYIGGKRNVIGEAVVDFDGVNFDITAKITSEEAVRTLKLDSVQSLSVSMDPRGKPEVANVVCPPPAEDLLLKWRPKGKK